MVIGGYVQYGAGTIQEQIDSGKSICILSQEITKEDVMSKLKKRTNIPEVITSSGLGNEKEGFYGRTGVTFVAVNNVDWYVRRMEHGIGMDESRRNHERQIQAAIDADELHYYEPMEEFDFLETMKDWNSMNHADKPKGRIVGRSGGVSYNGVSNKEARSALSDVFGYTHVEQVFNSDKIGRNDKCPCGSNTKYKKCCGRNV
jgi:hypothetical protein